MLVKDNEDGWVVKRDNGNVFHYRRVQGKPARVEYVVRPDGTAEHYIDGYLDFVERIDGRRI